MSEFFFAGMKKFLLRTGVALGGLFALFLFSIGTPALAEDKALLQLDTGGPRGTIWDMVFSHDGKQLISVGDDKMVRVWSLKKGKTVRIFRGEADEGAVGKLYAVALSPDDRWLAVAGWANRGCDGTKTKDQCGDIRLYDMRNGQIIALLAGHKNVVRSLAFSARGELLSGSDDATAILWDVQQSLKQGQGVIKVKFQDEDSEYVTGARFLVGDTQIVTTDSDGILRIWSLKGGKPLRTIVAHPGEQRILALDVSKDGKLIATGAKDGTLRLFDASNGKYLRTIAQGNYVSALKFSPDSTKILTGMAGSGPWVAHVYDVANGKTLVSYEGHDNVVNAVAISPDGRWAISAGGTAKEIHQWDLASGRFKQKMLGVGGSIFSVGFRQKGKYLSLLWGRTDPCPGVHSCPNQPGKLQFKMRLPTNNRGLQRPRAWKGAQTTAIRALAANQKMRLIHRKERSKADFGTLEIIGPLGAKKITRYDYSDGKEHLSYSLTPDGKTIISGGRTGTLEAYGLTGEPRQSGGHFKGHTGPVWSIAVSPDGRFVLSGSDDQTVRLWNAKTGELIVTLFHSIDNEWIVWTPQGFYSSSGDGDKMVGWQINQGPAREARFLSAEQLKDYLNKPTVVNRAIVLGSAKRAAQEYFGDGDDEDGGEEKRELQNLLKLRAPDFDILSPRPDETIDTRKLRLKLRNNSLEAGDVEYSLWVNDINVDRQRGFSVIQTTSDPDEVELNVPLARGNNKIRILARNIKTRLTTEQFIDVTGLLEGQLNEPGTLYLMAIGINKYPTLPDSDLKAAVADATGIFDMLIRKTPLQKVVARLLVDNPDSVKLSSHDPQRVELLDSLTPSAVNIVEALKMFERAKPQDTVIIFIAGHGVNEKGRYLFLPNSAQWAADGSGLKKSSVLSWSIFDKMLATTRGRRILFNDSCHSGNSFNEKFANDTADDMVIAFSAADKDTEAEEFSANERADGQVHGIFTDAILRAMEGAADLPDYDRVLDFKELEIFVIKDVVKNSKNGQVPEINARHFKPFVFAHPEG